MKENKVKNSNFPIIQAAVYSKWLLVFIGSTSPAYIALPVFYDKIGLL